MATTTNEIYVSDENGSRKLEGQELIDFLADRKLVSDEENARKAAEEKDYYSKLKLRDDLIVQLGLSPEQAEAIFPAIPKPIHLI